MKWIGKYEREVVLMIIFIVCAVAMILTCATTADIALANAQGDNSNVQILCDEFTNDVSLQGDASKTIHQYATYIDERFEIGNINAAAGITDEWIFQIVPKAVFDMQPDDFLYIGRQYGFYVDYDSEDASYLVYFVVVT